MCRGPLGDLSGHVGLVTGGNGGIGLGLACGLAQAGAAVAIWGRDPTKNRCAEERLKAFGTEVLALVCDVADEAEVADAFTATVAKLGKVDSVFANAGVADITPFLDTTLEQWRRVLQVNLDGAFLCLREGARHLVSRGDGGSLVAVSSIGANYGSPRSEAYGVSKAGLLALVRSLAVEFARQRIRCNALLPGWTVTDMNETLRRYQPFVDATTGRTPVGRWATPDDYHRVAAFLADPALTFHTGAAMVVDGGYSVF